MDESTEYFWAERLAALRWPGGRACACGCREHYHLRSRPRVFECRRCGRQQSVTAGTIFHRTRLPLERWVRAIDEISRGPGVSSRALARELGVHLETAWQMLLKVQSALRSEEGLLGGELDVIGWSPRCRRPRSEQPRVQILMAVDSERRAAAFVGLPWGVLPFLVRLFASEGARPVARSWNSEATRLYKTLHRRVRRTHRGVSERWLLAYVRATVFLWRSWGGREGREVTRAPRHTRRAVLAACLGEAPQPFHELAAAMDPRFGVQAAA